eukprot:m.118486 g.118486  ORF g.118486 m.118486 type:complete len:75 (-) comp12895_c0_seq3:126-350(-)
MKEQGNNDLKGQISNSLNERRKCLLEPQQINTWVAELQQRKDELQGKLLHSVESGSSFLGKQVKEYQVRIHELF